jgi:hypothetical protein
VGALAPHIEIFEFLFHALLGLCRVNFIQFHRILIVNVLKEIFGRVVRWFVFKPKFPILGNFWRVLKWKMLAYFMDIWSTLQPFGILYGHLVYFVVCNLVYCSPFWYVVPRKSGNPDLRILNKSKLLRRLLRDRLIALSINFDCTENFENYNFRFKLIRRFQLS